MGGFRAPTAVGGFRARSSRLAATRPRTPPRRVAISNRIVRLRSAATLNPRSLAPSFPTRTLTATLSIGSLPFCFECRLVPAACQLSSSALATSVHSSPPSASNFAHRHSSSLLHPRPRAPPSSLHCPHPQPLPLPLPLPCPFPLFRARPIASLSLSLPINPGPCPYHYPLPFVSSRRRIHVPLRPCRRTAQIVITLAPSAAKSTLSLHVLPLGLELLGVSLAQACFHRLSP